MENDKKTSPRILTSGWGKMEIDGLGSGKDFKLWPGGGRRWDWTEFGTDHGSGIHEDEVSELIANRCDTVILTTGRFKRLKIPETTVRILERQGIEVIVTDTENGIELYNQYIEKGIGVGGLFHSTC